MRVFGGFRREDRFFYGEIRGDEVHVLRNPFWIDIDPTGEIVTLTNIIVDLPVAPSKLRFPNIKPISKRSWPSSLTSPRRMFSQNRRWILFSVTRLVWTSAIEICKRPRSNLVAANHLIPTHRLGRLFMPTLM
jgi:hypothetical protein